MTAQIGDRLRFAARRPDESARMASVLEAGARGDRPCRRFTDGTGRLVFAGPEGVDATGDTAGGGV